MQLHEPHQPARSRPLVSIALAFAALFIPGCEALEPFLRARTLDRMVTESRTCAVSVVQPRTNLDRAPGASMDKIFGLLRLE